MKLLLTSAFALGATFSSVSAEDCPAGGCKKKGDGCKKKEESALTVSFNNEEKKDGGCKKGGGCKKKKAE